MTYPIQPGKVQAPALRDETLARARLLDWLEAKVHSRVIFVIADAGYGKTTLLADFSRRTRVRTIWYRLDEDDRDWVGFLSHLVAAGREHDPGFAPRTTAMLSSLESGGPTRDDAIAMFLKELPAIAGDGSAALVLDDFHLADEVADVRLIVREILARAPERLSVVFASRRQPPIPVSKLRAIGELAELGIADLRFSDAELEQLFRETYQRPLEPDVLMELARRTEGWAASLTLVQAALRERSPAETRAFVRGLSGARDELHDYLAEEVVGDLPQIHQQFLMRTSVLQVVTPELAQIATGLEAVEVQSLMLESERLGLLGRRPNRRSSAQRYHPLVREFLEERLRRAIGPSGVEELHVAVARWAEATDWRTAAYHFAAAARWPDLRRILDTYLETVIASGGSSTAIEFVEMMPAISPWPTRLVLESRIANASGDYVRGGALASRAADLAPDNDVAIGTLLAARMLEGRYGEASTLLDDLSRAARTPLMQKVARATRLLVATSVDGDLKEAAEVCEALAEECRAVGLVRYEGVSWLNAAHTHLAFGRVDRAQTCSALALAALTGSDSGAEFAAARSLDATLAAITNSMSDARDRFEKSLLEFSGGARVELLSEYAEAEVRFGDLGRAEQLLAGRREGEINSSSVLVGLLSGLILVRRRDGAEALRTLRALERGRPGPIPGHEARLHGSIAIAAAITGDSDARSMAQIAIQYADRQGAHVAEAMSRLALGYANRSIQDAIHEVPSSLAFVFSDAAELVAADLDVLDRDALDRIETEARRAPERWRPVLRHELDNQTKSALQAARLLDVVGERMDVSRLKRMARRSKTTGGDRLLGSGLARRLAGKVEIEDLGRVTMRLATETIAGSDIRRKVLGLLCFLLSRPRWAATREEVMEAMWPEYEPSAAVNSLNQSVYYLRRVFENEYSEETTAGYLHQDSDLIWLDRELIRAASADCVALVAAYDKSSDPQYAVDLAQKYTGKFALDFAYEDWSADFREWLHVAYLHVVETQVKADADAGLFDRGISIARHALALEPRNEELELSLLKLLRGAGAHSAAAEQYARYANVLRADLGVEPPTLDAV